MSNPYITESAYQHCGWASVSLQHTYAVPCLHAGCQWELGSPGTAELGELQQQKEPQEPSTPLGLVTPMLPPLSDRLFLSLLLRHIPSYRRPLHSWITAWGIQLSSQPARPATPCRWVCAQCLLPCVGRIDVVPLEHKPFKSARPEAFFLGLVTAQSMWNKVCFIRL